MKSPFIMMNSDQGSSEQMSDADRTSQGGDRVEDGTVLDDDRSGVDGGAGQGEQVFDADLMRDLEEFERRQE